MQFYTPGAPITQPLCKLDEMKFLDVSSVQLNINTFHCRLLSLQAKFQACKRDSLRILYIALFLHTGRAGVLAAAGGRMRAVLQDTAGPVSCRTVVHVPGQHKASTALAGPCKGGFANRVLPRSIIILPRYPPQNLTLSPDFCHRPFYRLAASRIGMGLMQTGTGQCLPCSRCQRAFKSAFAGARLHQDCRRKRQETAALVIVATGPGVTKLPPSHVEASQQALQQLRVTSGMNREFLLKLYMRWWFAVFSH